MSAKKNMLIKLGRLLSGIGFRPDWYLIPLAAVVGALTGLVALGFGRLVEFSERMFQTELGEQTLGRYGWAIFLLPAIGGLLVGLIKKLFRLQLVSHSVPDVIESLARRKGLLHIKSGIFAAINPAITIGSGGSAGQEGPIIHIGSVIGSVVGRALHVNPQHMGTLVGCGAAAGLAAIFNAPIAGVLLVLEVMLRDFSLKTFMPVVIASVFGTLVLQAASGHNEALFAMPATLLQYHFRLPEIGLFLLLGIGCGFAGWGFAKAMQFSEHAWTKVKLPSFIKPMIGGLILGGSGLLFVMLFRKQLTGDMPPFFGNGYPFITSLMTPETYRHLTPGNALLLLFALAAGACVLKIIGTSLTLGSGGSGGVFAPSLFIGATLGAAFGMAANILNPAHTVSPAAYALAGMAGVLAGSVHCPLTAFILVFELTRDYQVILPVMLVSIIATIISQVLMRDSIYTLPLREMGLRIGTMSDLTVLRRLNVEHVRLTEAVTLFPGDPVQRVIDLSEHSGVQDFVVINVSGQYVGMVNGDDIRTTLFEREAVPLLVVAEIMHAELPTVQPDETLDMVMDKFSVLDVASLAVVDPGEKKVRGLITRGRLMRCYREALDES
ncbi:MAG: chloride channel protein [Phycisphaeraceae bacterium]